MLSGIGFVIVLYSLTQMMSGAFTAFENAVEATFETIEVAAVISKLQLLDTHN
jgi:hypothetical protein